VLIAAWLVALLAQASAGETPVTPGVIEGRPPAAQRSPLQALVDAAAIGGVVDVPPGVYDGDVVIDRPVRLVGRGRPRLVGSGAGSVVRIRADDVLIEGFDIDGRLGGDLARDSSGIHVAGRRVVVRECRIVRALFGVYLREAHESTVERTQIDGVPGKDPGEQGSGIHVWNTTGFRLLDNAIRYSRDGFYLQSATHGIVARNTVSEVRYGLHYMFSDDNVFEDNLFERSAAGAALMYSRRLVFRRNRFLRNRGFTSVGLLLKTCDEVVAEDNLIADNARGVFLEGSNANAFRRNLIAQSDVAVVIYDSSGHNRFEGNAFIGNFSPLQLVGRRTDTVFAGNYWSDGIVLDLDNDGVADQPYRLSNVFDHLRGNLTAADLFAQSLGASVLSAAERAFPVLDPVPVLDDRPLARPPILRDVPRPPAEPDRLAGWGVAGSAAGLVFGTAVLWSGRRRRPTRSRSRTKLETP
jgi:nitrous oxidase accessory protein